MADSKADKTFEEVVQRFEPQSKLLRIWELKGGVSAQVTVIEVERPNGRTKKMIVRQHGEVDLKHNPHIAEDEFKLLQLLHFAGLAVPKPYYLDQSGEIFATPYVVIEYIEGAPILGPQDVEDTSALGDARYSKVSIQFSASGRRNRPHPTSTQPPSLRDQAFKPSVWVGPVADFIPQLAMQLYMIHKLDCAKLEVSFLPLQEKSVAEKLGERPEKVDEALEEGNIRDVLEAVWPFPQGNTSVLLHGDFWPGNILWRDGQLVGVIDWEDASLGDPLADVANTRLELLWAFGIEAMQSFTHGYQSMTTIDFTNLPFWDLYAALRPISQIAGWGLDDITEKTMRERHRWFVAQAFKDILK